MKIAIIEENIYKHVTHKQAYIYFSAKLHMKNQRKHFIV